MVENELKTALLALFPIVILMLVGVVTMVTNSDMFKSARTWYLDARTRGMRHPLNILWRLMVAPLYLIGIAIACLSLALIAEFDMIKRLYREYL